MAASLKNAPQVPDASQSPGKNALVTTGRKWQTWLFWLAPLVLLACAVGMRLYTLNVPFDRDSYDEGVYWQSLLALLHGNSLYHTTFYSQPPMFLLSVFPTFALFGGTLWSARLGVVLVSLLGFAGVAMLGKAVAGRLGILIAVLLLLSDTRYVAESQILQAEAPSVAFTLLALGAAFLWQKRPDGWWGACLAALAGASLALSILCKLLCVSTIVPLGWLLLERAWQIWQKYPGTSKQSWWPLLAGVGTGLLVTILTIVPFLGDFHSFWADAVTFHQAAAVTAGGSYDGNFHMMQPALFTLLGLTALYGTLTALARRDWRVLPLLAWFFVTCLLLLHQRPLLEHHLMILDPLYIALALLGIAKPASASSKPLLTSRRRQKALVTSLAGIALTLLLLTSAISIRNDISHYQSINAIASSSGTQHAIQVANDLRQAIPPDEWVLTDAQFIAGLADRQTPPSLVDTSDVRIGSGYLTLTQLEQAASNPRVHAVLFFTGRLTGFPQTSVFLAWVAQHFHLLKTYGAKQELWVR